MKYLRYILVVVGVVLIVGTLAAIKGTQIGTLIAFGEESAKNGPPPETVNTTAAVADSWERTIDAVGSVASSKGVAMTAEVPGKVTAVRFESGDTVKAGTVLAELDASTERAQLRSLLARKRLASTTLTRTRMLTKGGAVPAAQLDVDTSSLDAITADVAALRAQINKKTIRAPFSGRLGIRAVNLGQYLNPGEPVAVLESVDGVFVDITLPQQDLEVAVGMAVRVTSGGSNKVRQGTISAVDPTVDAVMRSIRVRATIDEAEGDDLRPGMFVDVAIVIPQTRQVVAVPATAIVHAPYGDSVFIVEDKASDAPGLRETADGQVVKVARQQFVRVGDKLGDFVAVAEGVTVGQIVVSVGAFKLRNGSPVVVSDTPPLTPELHPTPENR